MDHKSFTDVASGSFRLRRNDPHAASNTIVDLHGQELIALTTVDVSDGAVVLHCLSGTFTPYDLSEDAESGDDDDQDGRADAESDDEEAEQDDEEADDAEEEEEEDEDDDAEHLSSRPGLRTFTVARGNSITVRAAVVRLEPVGKQTAEGSYRVHVLKAGY